MNLVGLLTGINYNAADSGGTHEMKQLVSQPDRGRYCDFFQPDEKGHWDCGFLRFSGQPVALVTSAGRIEWATSSAHHLLQRYWPERHGLETRIPVKIWQWMMKRRKSGNARKKYSQATSPLIIIQPPGRLVIRALHDGKFTALAFEESLLELPAKDLIKLGLTQREAEVLRWLAEGKTSQEIATILEISPRTVSKHLRRVYQELGVENRHAAVAMAWEAVKSVENTKGKT